MSKSTRTRRRLADIDLFSEGEEIVDNSQNLKKINIQHRYTLNDVHQTFLELCVYEKTKMVFVSGAAGTAKTFLATLAALTMLIRGQVRKIVYIRSIAESAEKSIGALPGEVDEKFKPWSLPLLDKLHELVSPREANLLIESHYVQCIPVNFVRGLTFHNSVVIVDEAQNLTEKEIISILTRFGHNTKFIIAGDPKQSDIKNTGYIKVFTKFNDEESADHGVHCVQFGENEIVRSHILKFIVRKLGC